MSAPKPKDVLPLAQEITRLEAQLAEAKRKWNLLFGIAEPDRKGRAAASVDGVTAKALAHIDGFPGVGMSISVVAHAIGEEELPVGRALYRLAKTGKISNPKRGLYMSLKRMDAESGEFKFVAERN